jgi:hypothetical protein
MVFSYEKLLENAFFIAFIDFDVISLPYKFILDSLLDVF